MTSKISLVALGLSIGILGTLALFPFVASSETVQSQTVEYREPIPVIDAYYEGRTVWFIHPDTTNKSMASLLSTMVDYPSYHAPALRRAVNQSRIPPIYVFTNGVNRSDAEPWGGGPFNYQIDVIGSVPGDKDYMPLRRPYKVRWKENASPRVLQSVSAIKAAQRTGELTINQTDMVVNAPVVRFPGEYALNNDLLTMETKGMNEG